jgi:dTDP-glucose 4,6-dehydratase
MQHVLITVGWFHWLKFVRYLLGIEPDIQVFNLDALTYAGSLENLQALPDPQRHTFVTGNVCDRTLVEEVIRQNKVDTVVHFAAETHVDRSIVDPETCLKTNVFGTNTMLEAVRQVWIAEKLLPLNKVHFHHISTDEVFGSLAPGEAAFSETTPYAPILLTLRPRLPATTWCAPTVVLMVCQQRSQMARIIMVPTSFQRS